MKNLTLVLVLISILSCNNTSQEKEVKKPLKIYQRTEMALLMLDMYAEMEHIKDLINNDNVLTTNIPKSFYNIYTGKLTKPSVRDDNYKVFSNQYLNSLEYLYTNPKSDQKTNYNNVINNCITCHQVKCFGPIEKIKKLYLKTN